MNELDVIRKASREMLSKLTECAEYLFKSRGTRITRSGGLAYGEFFGSGNDGFPVFNTRLHVNSDKYYQDWEFIDQLRDLYHMQIRRYPDLAFSALSVFTDIHAKETVFYFTINGVDCRLYVDLNYIPFSERVIPEFLMCKAIANLLDEEYPISWCHDILAVSSFYTYFNGGKNINFDIVEESFKTLGINLFEDFKKSWLYAELTGDLNSYCNSLEDTKFYLKLNESITLKVARAKELLVNVILPKSEYFR